MRRIRKQWSRWIGTSALVALLTGCGGQATAQTAATTAATQQTIPPTATVAQPTPTAEATATPTALPSATATPIPSTPTAAPTPTPAVRTSSSSATTGYTADFARWPVATPGGADPARVSYDAATSHYTIALTATDHAYVHWQYAPEGRAFGDFTLDVDGEVAAGPPAGSWGVLFRAQPRHPGDKTNAGYDLVVTPSKREVSVNWTSADGHGTVLALATVAAIHTDNSSNHVHLTVRGKSITVVVNGQTVGTATGPSNAPGAVGLVVLQPAPPTGSSAMKVEFSHLSVNPSPTTQ